jgi:nucleotide-binding universal stress UspA family protein
MRNEIVVGLDNSPSGKAALEWAAGQAMSAGAVLRAVHVLDWPYGLSSIGFPLPMNHMDVTREEMENSYREAITAVFEAVSPAPTGSCSSPVGTLATSWFSSLKARAYSS